MFDLVGHSSTTLPYEHTSAIRRIAISPDNRFLLSVDEVGGPDTDDQLDTSQLHPAAAAS